MNGTQWNQSFYMLIIFVQHLFTLSILHKLNNFTQESDMIKLLIDVVKYVHAYSFKKVEI